MNPQEFRKIRIDRGLTQAQMGELLGNINPRTVRRYESGELKIPEWVVKILDLSKKTENNTK